jgi:hypothetical protein
MRHLLLLPIPVLFSVAFPDSVFYALSIFAISALAEEDWRELFRAAPAVAAFALLRPAPEYSLLALTAAAAAAPFSTAGAAVAALGTLALGLRPEAAPFYVLSLGAQLILLMPRGDDI